MAKIFEETPNNTTQTNTSQSTNSQTQSNSSSQTSANSQESQGLFSLPPIIMQFVPWIIPLLEQATGQKIPQMTGTMAEIQFTLNQVFTNQQTILNNQGQIAQRIMNLEKNANLQLTNLTQQFQSLRLTNTKERPEIDY